MTAPSQHFLLIGLPGTGKTSYLAALWYMVSQPTVECALRLEKLEGDSKYLNAIRDAWLQYHSVPRNLAESEKTVSMILNTKKDGTSLELTFPDLSGESFRMQWTQRQLTGRYDELLRKASGGILFVHPETIIKPHRIDTANALIAAIGADIASDDEVDSSNPTDKAWEIEKAPTQVQLVDLLQFIISRDYFAPPFRLALVVSAWDLVKGSHQTPADWISSELPLLRQFLDANSDAFVTTSYGVSAQGGRYESPLLIPANFIDVGAFVTELSQRGKPLAAWVWDQFGPEKQNALLESVQDLAALQVHLAAALNIILAMPSIYDATRFEGVKLRADTKEILKGPTLQIGEATLRLNRLLLEDAYPTSISRTRQHAEEAAKLQQQAPARRTLIVGTSIANPHDVTEPVQWLLS